MTFDLEKKLKNIPSQSLTPDEKELLWSKIERKLDLPAEKPSSFFGFANVLKPKLAFTALSLLIIVGSVTTFAVASNSKPGDTLFPVKIATEKVRIMLSSGEKKNDLEIQFAQKRLDEAKSVLASVNTETASSTAPANVSSATSSENVHVPEIKNIKRAGYALDVALDQLQKTKSGFEKEKNSEAAAKVDKIMTELKTMAEDHVSALDKIQEKISGNDEVKKEIKTTDDDIKMKFNINGRKSKENDQQGNGQNSDNHGNKNQNKVENNNWNRGNNNHKKLPE